MQTGGDQPLFDFYQFLAKPHDAIVTLDGIQL
jgi:hypothetical protein